MPRKLYDLVKEFDIGFKDKIKVWEGDYDEKYAETFFKPYSECTKEQRKLIDKRRKDIEEFRKRVRKDPSPKYDEKGFITLPIYEQGKHSVSEPAGHVEQLISGKMSEQDFLKTKDAIIVPITQRELAQIGLLPEDFSWTRQEREVTTAEMAESAKDKQLTTKETNGIRVLFEKLKNLFKGRGER